MKCKICLIDDNYNCDCYYRAGGWDEHNKIVRVLDWVEKIREESHDR